MQLNRSVPYLKAAFIIFALALLCIFSTNVTATATPLSRFSEKTGEPVSIIHDSLKDCPDASPLIPSASPSLYFCSPKYKDQVEGPFNSEIVVLGRNFPSAPTGFYLTPKQTFSQDCASDIQTDCFILKIPSGFFKKVDPKEYVFKFAWTFTPTTYSLPTNFYLIATYLDTTQKFMTVVVTPPFTLLSVTPPCITITAMPFIAHTVPSNCSSEQRISIQAGKSLFIQGYNWLPENSIQQNVIVSITCIKSAVCSSQQPFRLLVAPDSSGFFQQELPLPQHMTGSYHIAASNQVPTGDGTVASGSLTLTTPLIFTVTKFNSSLPIPLRKPFDMLPFISLAFALLSLATYFLVRRRLSALSVIQYNQEILPSSSTREQSEVPKTDKQLNLHNRANNDIGSELEQSITQVNVSFNKRADIEQGNDDTHIQILDEAISSLHYGDYEPAVRLAIMAQAHDYDVWKSLLEEVAKAEAPQKPSHVKKEAYDSFTQAIQYPDYENQNEVLRFYCTSILLYRWLLNAIDKGGPEAAEIWYYIGFAYSHLPREGQQTLVSNLEEALTCYQIALYVYYSFPNREAFAEEIARIQDQLGNLYQDLPIGNRDNNLEAAIASYQLALQYYKKSKDKNKINLARILNSLGLAFSELESGNRQDNVKQAISYYIQAIDYLNVINIHEIDPIEKAVMLSNLGEAYYIATEVLQKGRKIDQRSYSQHAINYYQKALEIYEQKGMDDQVQELQACIETATKRLNGRQ